MALSIGIVGLPNVGKSTLFNALTKKAAAEASNYPFTTIEPNIGIVSIPDPRLAKLADIVKPEKVVAASVQFVDIAGLVAGAHKGEGLGNQFLAHIRETDAIALVVRCFEDPDVTHVSGKIRPLEDIRTILLELILADQQTLEKLLDRDRKAAKGNDKDAAARVELLERIAAAFDRENLASKVGFSDEERKLLGPLPLITLKPMLYVANVDENDVAHPGRNTFFQEVEAHAEEQGTAAVAMSAKIEAEIAALPEAEQAEFLETIGLEEPNLDTLIRAAYRLLGWQTFLTAGPKEVRAWQVPVGATAPEAAGVIHGDFQDKFIRADVTSFDDYMAAGGEQGARDAGKLRSEGKEYVVQDGDVMNFRHGA
jgi:GTP-binding protein YchF